MTTLPSVIDPAIVLPPLDDSTESWSTYKVRFCEVADRPDLFRVGIHTFVALSNEVTRNDGLQHCPAHLARDVKAILLRNLGRVNHISTYPEAPASYAPHAVAREDCAEVLGHDLAGAIEADQEEPSVVSLRELWPPETSALQISPPHAGISSALLELVDADESLTRTIELRKHGGAPDESYDLPGITVGTVKPRQVERWLGQHFNVRVDVKGGAGSHRQFVWADGSRTDFAPGWEISRGGREWTEVAQKAGFISQNHLLQYVVAEWPPPSKVAV